MRLGNGINGAPTVWPGMVLTVPLKLTVPLWSSAAREFLCGPVVLLTVPLAGSSGFELKLECMDHCYRIGDRGRNIGCFCPVSVRRQSGVGNLGFALCPDTTQGGLGFFSFRLAPVSERKWGYWVGFVKFSCFLWKFLISLLLGVLCLGCSG